MKKNEKKDFALKSFWSQVSLLIDSFIKIVDIRLFHNLGQQKQNFLIAIIKEAKGNNKILWKNIDKLSGQTKSQNQIIKLKINGEEQHDNLVVAKGKKILMSIF